MKKASLYKKSFLIYTIILCIIAFIFLTFIFFTLKEYENNQTGNFLKSSINNLDDSTLKKYLNDNGKDESLLSIYKNMVKSPSVVFEKVSDDVFTATLNNRLLFTITTKVVKEGTKLGLFSYQEREVVEINPELKRGLIYYDVTIPSNFTLKINDTEYSEYLGITKYDNLEFMYVNENMPSLVTYEINDLTEESKIIVKDFLGNEVKTIQSNYTYQVENTYYNVDTLEEAKYYLPDILDVMEVAHNWSLFLTNDLKGTYHGFYTIEKYLIKDTPLYQMAYNWAHNVDITFTSRHTLKNPIWTNEKLSNFKIYGSKAFSCEIYLEKNMVVNNVEQKDIMHDNLYFIKDNENNWKLINIKSVEDEQNE